MYFQKKKKKLFLKKINIFSFHEFLTVNTIFFYRYKWNLFSKLILRVCV